MVEARVGHAFGVGHVPLVEHDQALPVQPTTVDVLLERHGIDHVNLLKVDIEGSEVGIFARPRDWMERVDRIVVEIHDKYIDGDIVRRTPRGTGFRPVPRRVPDPVGFNPVEL